VRPDEGHLTEHQVFLEPNRRVKTSTSL